MSESAPWWEVYRSLGFMSGARQEQTLQAWARMFEAEGRDEADLIAAAYAIARREKIPSFAEEHLQALRQELRRIDGERAHRTPSVYNRQPCALCGDTGVVCGLPHLRYLDAGGYWMASIGGPEYTQAAACDRCTIGRSKPAGQMCTLTQYEQENPHWLAQLNYHRDYRAERSAALRAARQDPAAQHPESAAERLSLDKFFQRIKDRMSKTRAAGGVDDSEAGSETQAISFNAGTATDRCQQYGAGV